MPNVEKAREALVTLDGDPTLSDLARNPLYLTLMSLLIEQGKVLEGNRTQLYDDIFDLLLSGQHRRRRQTEKIKGIDRPEFVRLALQHLAYEMSQQNRDTATCEDLEEQLETDASIIRKLHKVRDWRDNLPVFFDDVGELTGILGPHARRSA